MEMGVLGYWERLTVELMLRTECEMGEIALMRRSRFGIAVDTDIHALRWQVRDYTLQKARAILFGQYGWPGKGSDVSVVGGRKPYLHLLREHMLRTKRLLES